MHETKQKMRAGNKLLRITFADGTVICDKSSRKTFVDFVKKAGVERVLELGIEYCNVPLISKEYEKNKNYAQGQMELGDGWLLAAFGNTDSKLMIARSISEKLALDAKIEIGEDFEPISSTKRKTKEKIQKARLKVELPDGTSIYRGHSRDTFVDAIRFIGVDKVKRVEYVSNGLPLISSRLINSINQVEIEDRLYLTIPGGGTKGMCKALRVIAAMCHAKLTPMIS